MAVFASAAVPAASAQSVRPFVFDAGERVSLEPDGSYVFNHSERGLVFEAQIAPDLQILGNFEEQLRRVLDEGRPRVRAYAVYATPMFRLRMLHEPSNPVRTPSYMPKASVQVAWLRNLSAEDEPPERHDGPIRMWLLHAVPFGHHSNGQQGCLFVDQRSVDDECRPVEAADRFTRQVNTTSGSFSTNYVQASVGYRRLYPRGDLPEEPGWVTAREWGLSVGVELNPPGYLAGSMSDELRRRYGPTRLKATGDVAVRDWTVCRRAAGELSAQYIHDAPPGMSVTVAVEASCLPGGWGGTGVFIRYYRGQDYYNVNFLNRIHRLQFGFAFDQPKFLQFALP